MTDKEMAKDYAEHNQGKYTNKFGNLYQAYLAGLEYNNKQIAELKEKISVLLSCKNCSENKGGWICAKEYENKCLAQKIAFIKELKKENAQLKSKNCWKTCKYAEPKSQWISQYIQDVEQLTKAKEIIKKLVNEFYYLCELYNFATDYECLAEADQFLNSEVEK